MSAGAHCIEAAPIWSTHLLKNKRNVLPHALLDHYIPAYEKKEKKENHCSAMQSCSDEMVLRSLDFSG